MVKFTNWNMFHQLGSWYNEDTFYKKNKSWLLVLISQIFAVFINTSAKYLETRHSAVSPLQILAVRMAVTLCGSSLFLWRKFPAEFPLGNRDLRPLFILRAIGGVLAAIGFYCEIAQLSFLVAGLIIWTGSFFTIHAPL